jgi:hypothetical protein
VTRPGVACAQRYSPERSPPASPWAPPPAAATSGWFWRGDRDKAIELVRNIDARQPKNVIL